MAFRSKTAANSIIAKKLGQSLSDKKGKKPYSDLSVTNNALCYQSLYVHNNRYRKQVWRADRLSRNWLRAIVELVFDCYLLALISVTFESSNTLTLSILMTFPNCIVVITSNNSWA